MKVKTRTFQPRQLSRLRKCQPLHVVAAETMKRLDEHGDGHRSHTSLPGSALVDHDDKPENDTNTFHHCDK